MDSPLLLLPPPLPPLLRDPSEVVVVEVTNIRIMLKTPVQVRREEQEEGRGESSGWETEDRK